MAPLDAGLIFGAVFEHRTTCLRTLEERVNTLLDDPKITKRQLRARLHEAVEDILTRGPDGRD